LKFFLSLAALLFGFVAPHHASAADPNALWNIIHDRCVPHQQQTSDPAPCTVVDLDPGLAHGYVVLKDLVGKTQFLVMPTVRISGIESPQLLSRDAANYWQDAWEARQFVIARAGQDMARDQIGMAINSRYGRSQNQLHIHVDCVRPDVHEALVAHAAAIRSLWSPFPVALEGHSYMAMRIARADLSDVNPFMLLAQGVPGAEADMGSQTLVIVGAVLAGDEPGFYLLTDHADLLHLDRASGEDLLDHDCTILKTPTG
jgi:CDP-diacylglycerol pyrophosphatase